MLFSVYIYPETDHTSAVIISAIRKHYTFNKTLFDTKHIQINIYINLIICTQT